MIGFQVSIRPLGLKKQACGGFTLVEIMIGMVVTSIVAIGIFSTYNTSTNTVMTQRSVAEMQQQLRGSVYIMQRQIRAAGFDPQNAATAAIAAGITDIMRYSIVSDPNPATDPVVDPAGSPSLTIRSDLNSDGVLEQATYLIYDIDNDGINDLASSTGPGTYELVAEGMQAIGFAFAIDDDLDGELDTIDPGNPNSNLIWAVDANNDNLLDTNLDTNDDGVIDISDDGNSNNFIESTDNAFGALATPVALDRIRMVRIWLLSRSTRREKVTIVEGNAANQFYVVGDRLIAHANDGLRRRDLEVSVTCRNMGL